MYTQTITVKIDKNTNNNLEKIAKKTKRAKSEVVREAIGRHVRKTAPSAGESLIEMSDQAKEYKYSAPKDVVSNINKYLYGKKD